MGSVHLFTTLGISFDVVGVNETDVQLMADAPLLLEEVKRLREENDLLRSMQRDGIEASAHDNLLSEINRLREEKTFLWETYLKESAGVKRLREQIVDMIDSMDNYYIRDIQHATDCLRDIIGYYEDEEE